MTVTDASELKPVVWMGTSHEDLVRFSLSARRTVGFALYAAQQGDKHLSAKPLQGFGSAGVLEVVANDDGNTYRAVYTVRFASRVYVLHAFQKKSKSGVKTSKRDVKLIWSRLAAAEAVHKEFLSRGTGKP